MENIAKELQASTGAFEVSHLVARRPPKFLDMCAAPGGYLLAALRENPSAIATAFSLPVESGGHEVSHLLSHPEVDLTMLDITMLAADMGVDTALHKGHPDLARFLPKQLEDGRNFHIVICDGQVLRPNVHSRTEYRERSEVRRLVVTQLALGLEHLLDGGTMVVLCHKLELPDTIETLRRFHHFSTSVQLFKPVKSHAIHSTFYMVASGIQVNHPKAVEAVQLWKETWKIATFGSEEEFKEHVRRDSKWAEEMMEEFGEIFVEKGRPIWDIQATALAKKKWTR